MKEKKRKWKTGIIAIAVLLIYCIISAICIESILRITQREIYNSLSHQAKQSVEMVKCRIEGDFQTMEAIATLMGSHDTFNRNQILPILWKENEQNLFQNMGVATDFGIATMVDGREYDLSNQQFFRSALSGETTISDMLWDDKQQKSQMIYATPIYDGNEITDVLIAVIDTKVYNKLLSASIEKEAEEAYILCDNGIFVASSDDLYRSNRLSGPFSALKEAQFKENDDLQNALVDMSSGKDGHLEFVLNGERQFLSYEPMGINNWYLVSVISANVASQKDIYIIQIVLFAAIGTSLFLGLLLIYILKIQKENRKSLERLAFTDMVTGYGNWRRFERDSMRILASSTGKEYAMIIFDVDKFKVINDLYGHKGGNDLLKYIADVLNEQSASDETFARVSADHFNFLMRYYSDEDIVQRIKKINADVNYFEKVHQIVLSFGIYRIADKKVSINVLSDRANVARITVKNGRIDNFAFYDDAIRKAILLEKEIEDDMLPALINGDFKMYLQPKYLFKDETLVGAEALVRWIHSDKGLVMPGEFIPIFEKNGFIQKLDFFMLEQVCQFLVEWVKGKQDEIPFSISVNLSRVHLSNRNLTTDLKDMVSKYNVDPSLIEIELTESTIFNNIETLVSVISELRQIGFKISMDDFGSGYSSLNLLKDLQVDVLKIDQGFLNDAGVTDRGKIIITNVIKMAKQLNLITVAEGVETQEQVDFLKQVKCDIAQGYYYGKPMPVEEFKKINERICDFHSYLY